MEVKPSFVPGPQSSELLEPCHRTFDRPFRPTRPNQRTREPRRHIHPETVDRVLRKYASIAGTDAGYSAQLLRQQMLTQFEAALVATHMDLVMSR